MQYCFFYFLMEKHFTKEVKAEVQQQQPLCYSAAAEK